MAVVVVREASQFGPCNLLGELVNETATRYIYRRRHDAQVSFVDKRSPSIHVKACRTCSDYGKRD
jgi:hypothetical protein